MTPEIKRLLAQRVLARRRLLQFTKMTHPDYSAGWVHEDICRRLERFSQAVADKKSPRLMLLMPPRHGKSELASIRFPAWHLGEYPQHELINVGYNLDLPMKFSRKVREVMREASYTAIFPGAVLDPNSQSAEAWNTTNGGGFTAAGVGGGITGKGAHILIIDDPIKNQEEADSAPVRDKLWDWYQSTAYTRLAPGGGVLVIECMTGDTPVLMADGTERRIDQLCAGDHIATYEDGGLATTTVAAWKCSGRDNIFTITMSSGRQVRANGRHPFLAAHIATGELEWVRTQDLTTAHKIAVVKGSGVSGLVSAARQKGALAQSAVVGSALRTTVSRSGPLGIARRLLTLLPSAARTLSIATLRRLRSTRGYCWGKEGVVRFADVPQRTMFPATGAASYASTTATPLGGSEGCCVTSATSLSGSSRLNPSLSPQPDISDFLFELVVSVEPAGEEEVFDVQVDRTANFIANGLVSHNTWWNDDDLAGRLQNMMALDPEADQFEIVKYPALSNEWEYRDNSLPDTPILRFPEEQKTLPAHIELLRPKDFCLHEGRYPTASLKRIRANLQPRIWSALYQQNPVPDEGMYFKKDFFKYTGQLPPMANVRIYTAWDFAIGEKQQNDWTVGATILQDDTDTLYVLEIFRMKGDTFRIIEAMLDVAARWGSIPNTGYLIGAEDGQIWRAIEPMFKKRMSERRQYPPYEILRPLTDKMARARPLQGRMQQGRVVFPEGASWLPQAEQELLRFPAGVHDDVVDALAWAVHLCLNKAPPRVEVAPELKSWRDKLNLVGGVGSHMTA